MKSNKESLIIDEINNMIVTKEVLPLDKLPSENELAERFGVPRLTVRHALNQLEVRGQIFAKKGKGRYVREPASLIHLHLTGEESFSDKMHQAGYLLRTENLIFQKMEYDKALYQELEIQKENACYEVARVRYIDEQPLAIHRSYVSDVLFPFIEKDGPKITSMFSYYRQFGYTHFTSNKSLLSIVYPTAAEQELLNMPSMIPLILLESNTIDEQTGKLLEYTKISYRSDKFKYKISN
ncbi:transcriptional regulator [Alkalihalobacillus alcalophilus ATCC 27647 = CGMCC 1.3604]|uniref:Transcriptional regulator n=1 Tax=Alkalihalobacillus alcalophilus ATCC 27647 = CGMCC 1.3604 TaxID=1218173 RepID=A0A094YZP2_ALKAL|nr:GntR family transcriptional regulator [Alkalihalobacillus alcalophilus]KGA99037.1 transcriptional regulator [Alkalihalobacillus alcalophilus ATCC 27647 = CGMCC 1.3604]MED1560681.1 GntR family transcriptional regulator [Alkalihalobacillus alcalophilus]THG89819.1 transcriptional regulator [Alkalihalobacillus alcalophilus ATCC 27647 = CGMCC 1.3604]